MTFRTLTNTAIRTALFAAALPAAAERIALSRALQIAEQRHPSLKAGVARTEAAAGQILTAKAYPNPLFSFLYGRQYSQPPGGRNWNTPLFEYFQPLELGDLRPSRLNLAQRGVDSSQLALTTTRLEILSGVRRSFYEVLRHGAQIEIADQALRLAQDLRNRVRVRVEVGEVGRLELVRAEAEVATARSISANARIQQVTALAGFRAAIGGEVPPDLEPDGTLDAAPALPSLEALRKEVLDRHPSLSLARSEIQRADARLRYENALRRPQPIFRSEIDNTNPSYRFGVDIPLPFWNRRRGEIATAAAEMKEANFLASVQQNQLLAALEGAYGRYQVSNQEVEALEQGLMREAQEAVRAAEAAYQLGERSILEVLDAQRVLRTVRLNLLNAQYDRQDAVNEIDELRAVDLTGTIR